MALRVRVCSTWKSVDEPAQLFLGDVGPAEVQSCRLPPDDPAQHEGRDGLAAVQIDELPQPLVAAPVGTRATIRHTDSDASFLLLLVLAIGSRSCTHACTHTGLCGSGD